MIPDVTNYTATLGATGHRSPVARRRLRVLDLFCCAGGASMGYWQAFTEMGFDVDITGVDIKPQPRYPFAFRQADAMSWSLRGYDFIHASPPCQDYSEGSHITRAQKVHPDYPRLIDPIRQRLQRTRALWIIENVEGARKDMPSSVILCGTSFGLRVWRHRLFESNLMLFNGNPCNHQVGDVSVRRHRSDYIGIPSGVTYHDGKGRLRVRPKFCRFEDAKKAMGIDWMNSDELGESIPPAYTRWLGMQIARVLEVQP